MSEYGEQSSDGAGIRFDVDWIPAEAVTSEELASTWAALSIWIEGECVTRSEDLATGSSRKAIYLSLYPLAEWIAFNWWFLNSHSRPTMFDETQWTFEQTPRLWESPRPWWIKHHNLRAVGEGFPWPDLTIVPDAPKVRARWFADKAVTSDARVRMIGSGEAWLEHETTTSSLRHLVDVVIDRLESQSIHHTTLHNEWRAVSDADSEEAEFCLASARLGSDPYHPSIDPRTARTIVDAASRLTDSVLDDLVDAAAPQLLRESSSWVEQSINQLDRYSPSDGRSPFETSSLEWRDRPWTAGYQNARAFRTLVEAPPDAPIDLDDYVVAVDDDSPDRHLLGVTSRAGRNQAALVSGKSDLMDPTKRFLSARSLWHSLFTGERWSLVTDANTYKQRVGRAFAAELLAPASGIEQQLAPDQHMVSPDEVDTTAGHFGVSSLVVKHQIENQLGRQVATG